MSQRDGAGDGVATESMITASVGDAASDGYGLAPEAPLAERPELLLGAAFLGGLLLARLVTRRGR